MASWLQKRSHTPAKNPANSADLRNDFFDMADDFFKNWGLSSQGVGGSFTPAMNISETDDSYNIETELPGVSKQDVSVEMHDHLLTVKGVKKSFKEDKKENYHRVERSHGSFVRSVELPPDADREKISAKLEEGVLNIEIGKTTPNHPSKRKVEIK